MQFRFGRVDLGHHFVFAAVLLVAASGCELTYPSLGGLYVRTGELVVSDTEQASRVQDAVGLRFPDQIAVHQYSFEERPYADLPNGDSGPERAWQIAQILEAGTPDPDASGSLFHRGMVQAKGWVDHSLISLHAGDGGSDTSFSEDGHVIGPSCTFKYTVNGSLSFSPNADELTRATSGIYRRTFLDPAAGNSRGWMWSDIQSANWNPDATQLILAIRMTKTLAYDSLRTCQYNGRPYPQTTETITLAYHYLRKDVFPSGDLRKQIDRKGIMAAASEHYNPSVDAWKKAFNSTDRSFSVPDFFGPTRFPEE